MESKAWLEISAPSLRANLALAQEFVAPAAVIPVVKADAYGHGLELVCRALSGTGVPYFAVDSAEEAFAARRFDGSLPLLVLGYVRDAQLAAVVETGAALVCSKLETIEALARLATPARGVRIHLEVETGLYRQGAEPSTLMRMLARLDGLRDRVVVEGVCTHFANVEEPVPSNLYPALQEERFESAVAMVAAAGFAPRWRHIACSAAAWLRPLRAANAVRLGISLYGIWSSAAVRSEMGERRPDLRLRPVLAWKTRLAEVKTVSSGETVGYGRTERLERETRLAVLPIGYADGFDRALSSRGYVLVGGRRCRVLGRICMNMCMVDVSGVPGASVEDEAVVFGAQGGERLGPEDWEAWTGGERIAYEAVARLRAGLPRTLVDADES